VRRLQPWRPRVARASRVPALRSRRHRRRPASCHRPGCDREAAPDDRPALRPSTGGTIWPPVTLRHRVALTVSLCARQESNRRDVPTRLLRRSRP
jgi:hypothetical protein